MATAKEAKENTGISERDVVFECPSCAKSLAIDRRGAGLTISCPQCSEPVRVPMPQDELVQHPPTDHSEEFADATELQSDLDASQKKIQELTDSLNRLASEQEKMQTQRDAQQNVIAKLRHEFSSIQMALDNIYEQLGKAE